MTRLDPSPHRSDARSWTMDETHSRDGLNRRSGFKEEREKRESGYFSLGRPAGARAPRVNSPQAPFRHFERGHPIFNSQNIEPKDTVPFRNPGLGLASERQVPEVQDEDLPVEFLPPDPYDIAVEVEAQVGARSPSPTPFKIAESLAGAERKGLIRSYGRGTASYNSASRQFGRFDSSRQGSALQSRFSSPPRGNARWRDDDFLSPIRGHTVDATEPRLRGTLRGSHGRHVDSGTLPRNFKSLARSVKSQSSTVSDFRSALRKTEVSGSFSGLESRSSSAGQMSLYKAGNAISSFHGLANPTHAPSRRPSGSRRESRASSPARRTYSSSGQFVLRKWESMTSLDGRGHHGRCGSPIREGYDIESQAVLRNGLNGLDRENPSRPPTKCCYDTTSQPKFNKTGSNTGSGSQVLDSYSEKRSFQTTGQYPLRKTGSCTLFNGRESRNSSPSRRSDETSTQSTLRKSEVKTLDSRSSLPSKQSYRAPHQASFRKNERGSSLKRNNKNTRNASPSGNTTNDPPGYSVLRHPNNGEGGRSFQRKNNDSVSKSAPDRSPRSWRGSTPSLRSSSLSRAASPTMRNAQVHKNASVTLQTPRSPGGLRSRDGRRGLEDRYTTHHAQRSPSPVPPMKMRSRTLSQSSMDSSESVASAGKKKEDYATMADLPNVKRIHQRDEHDHMERPHQRSRRQQLFKPASHSLSKHPSREWEDTGETDREWHYGGIGYLPRVHSCSSLQRSCSPPADAGSTWTDYHHKSAPMQVCDTASTNNFH
ncbi:uncharacterized protein LOC127589370 [Hippocampus zosterae]|uniref:uncharacterized protein LOC127589370 n=1 Tax=Hippocampus zosterae TaxID=109293 RepID=UPI00223CF388|nr:uncharacterized protein LOC127589370 [Hippocampus zosterae]